MPSPSALAPSYSHYKKSVDTALQRFSANIWSSQIQHHRAQIPYSVVCDRLHDTLQTVRNAHLPWDTLLCVRAWCRLRTGLLYLSHVNGRRSSATYQSCIFCNSGVRNAVVHCMGVCKHWDKRLAFTSLMPEQAHPATADALALVLLSCHPSSAGFADLMLWCNQIDRESDQFWHQSCGE